MKPGNRPELMAVVIVGDIDVDDAEARVREHFGSLSNAPDAPALQEYDVEPHGDTRIGIFTDPEFPATAVQLLRKVDSDGLVTIGHYRDYLGNSLFYAMLNERLQERQRQEDAPFLYASAFGGGGTLGNVELHGSAPAAAKMACLTRSPPCWAKSSACGATASAKAS